MATVIHRRGRYYVVYNYKRQDGSVKQKWETYKTRAEADDRKKEVEYKQSIGTFKVKECKTLNDLLSEYVTLYGKENWAPSNYTGNIALIEHYISPIIGNMNCSPSTVKEVHKILRGCFTQAVKWDIMEKNPCQYAKVPKYEYKKRDIWDAETLFHSLRHTSITYKLKLNGGDIKSVQGDSGHAQVSMVTDVYSHILDEDRKYNAQKFEEEFYSGKVAVDTKSPESEKKPEEDKSGEEVQNNAALLLKLLSDPNMTGLLKTLMNTN